MKRFKVGQFLIQTGIGPDYYGQRRLGYVVRAFYPSPKQRADGSGAVLEMVRLTGTGRLSSCVYEHGFHLLSVDPKAKPVTFVRANRGDYEHTGLIVGRRAVVVAGCRSFKTLAGAINHWDGRKRSEAAYDKQRVLWKHGRFMKTYGIAVFVKQRAKDKRLNKFSLAFARKVERLRAKN